MVSIIIPVYNAEKYLKKCIDSVLNQSFNDYEIILINDGFTDYSGEICTEYSEKYCNIYTYHSRNQGVSNARNEGLKRASGEYVIFIDSDDELSEEYLKNIFCNDIENVDLVINDVKVMNERKEVLRSIGPLHSDLMMKNEIKSLLLSMDAKNKTWVLEYVWNKVYSKKVIDRFDIQFDTSVNLGEDFIFNCRYFENVSSILILSNNPYYYFVRNNVSLTKKFRIDEYERRKKIKYTMSQLFEKWGILEEKENDIKVIEGLYGLSSVNSIFLKECSLNYKQKNKFMKEFLESEYYEFILLYLERDTNFKNKIWRFLISRKLNYIYILLYQLINIKNLRAN